MKAQALTAVVQARRRPLNLALWLPVTVIVLFVLAAIAAPLIAPYEPNAQNLLGRMKPPGTTSRAFHYWLGSDELGRDLLSRLIHGARVSLAVAFTAALLSGTVGVVLGMLAGYLRGWVEVLVMRAGKVVAKEAIVQSLTSLDDMLSDNAIEQYVSRLRRRLQPHGIGLRTVRGIGYLLEKAT